MSIYTTEEAKEFGCATGADRFMKILVAAHLIDAAIDNFRDFYDLVVPVATNDENVIELRLDRPKSFTKPIKASAPGDALKLSSFDFARLERAEARLLKITEGFTA